MSTAIAKAFKPNPVMTLRELEAAVDGFKIFLACVKTTWIARGWTAQGWIGSVGATPSEAVENLLRRIGGAQ